MGKQVMTVYTTIITLYFLIFCAWPQVKALERSSKKGLCIPPGKNFYCGDLTKFPRASWWYNWHVSPNHEHTEWCNCPSSSDDCGVEPNTPGFVPMIWGYHEDQPWHDDESDPVSDKYPIILGFNEPNRADQSDLSPEVAAQGWMEIQKMYPDKTLVSPAPAGGNIAWFDQFFEECEALGCRIDYLATHDYTGVADTVMNHLHNLYNRYGLKIWLTEFAMCCTTDVTEVENFAREIIPRLEAANYVVKYSWFITRYNTEQYHVSQNRSEWYLDKVNALFEEGTWKLTTLGQIYN